MQRSGALVYTEGFAKWFSMAVIMLSFTAGAVLLMWLGEQIDSKGIGNGISLLIFTGIVSNLATAIRQIIGYFSYAKAGLTWLYIAVPIIVLLFAAMFVLIIVVSAAERRIPVQYAKRVVGRKMYGGQSSNIPLKVNMTGVLPVIFASAFLSVPGTIQSMFDIKSNFWNTFLGWFSTSNWGYAILYALLILAFNYFYVAVQYNPVEIANNLRKNAGSIPGIRPGKPTSDFIARVVSKVTLIGGIFLILVGVALEITNTLESYMLMRHHKGFLE